MDKKSASLSDAQSRARRRHGISPSAGLFPARRHGPPPPAPAFPPLRFLFCRKTRPSAPCMARLLPKRHEKKTVYHRPDIFTALRRTSGTGRTGAEGSRPMWPLLFRLRGREHSRIRGENRPCRKKRRNKKKGPAEAGPGSPPYIIIYRYIERRKKPGRLLPAPFLHPAPLPCALSRMFRAERGQTPQGVAVSAPSRPCSMGKAESAPPKKRPCRQRDPSGIAGDSSCAPVRLLTRCALTGAYAI